jgi:hypothetical protein
MTLDEALAVLERDRAQHLVQPCSARDLDRLEEALGLSLPSAYRELLERIGGGVLYDRHEVFGARRLILHDIELVADVLTARQRFEEAGRRWPAHLIPFHRCGGAIHLLDASGGAGRSPVLGDAGQSWPDLPDFLAAVVLPPAASTQARDQGPAPAGRAL